MLQEFSTGFPGSFNLVSLNDRGCWAHGTETWNTAPMLLQFCQLSNGLDCLYFCLTRLWTLTTLCPRQVTFNCLELCAGPRLNACSCWVNSSEIYRFRTIKPLIEQSGMRPATTDFINGAWLRCCGLGTRRNRGGRAEYKYPCDVLSLLLDCELRAAAEQWVWHFDGLISRLVHFQCEWTPVRRLRSSDLVD